MSLPKAYNPQEGYRYQILCRHPEYNGHTWEHCDYAVDKTDKNYLLNEYAVAHNNEYEYKSIPLPRKYWPAPGEGSVLPALNL